MAGEWKTVALGDVADTRNGAGIKQDFFDDTGVPLARVSNFTSDSINMTDCVHVDAGHARHWESHRLKHGDVVVATVGSWPPNWSSVVGKAVRVPCTAVGAIQNQNTCCVIARPTISDQRFLFYVLRIDAFVSYAANAAGGSANQARLPVANLKRYTFSLPPLPEQRAIAGVLGALDDKIELNRRTSRTLEKLARAIFRAWFVDFEPVKAKAAGARSFPSMPQETFDALPTRLVPSELGPIPEGWSVGRVADFGDVICGKTPPTKNPENYADDVPFITIPDMHNQVFVTDTGKKLSHTGANTQAKKFIPAKSICVSCIATAGLVVITSARAQTNQQINTVIPRKGISPYYCYEALSLLGDEIRAGGSGGSVLHNLNKSNFSALNVLLPMKDVLSHFDGVLSPLFETILANQKESRKLAEMRDYLLPKLLSGEVRVADAELFLEKTTS